MFVFTGVSEMEFLFYLLFLLLLSQPSWLYSLRNCIIDFTDPWNIDCRHQKLSRIPSDIPTSAMFLSLVDNKIEVIQQSDFYGLSELQMLDLTNNQISHIEDLTFSNLSSLMELSLNSNKLSNLTDGMFTELSNLTHLDLGSNPIKSISEFAFAPLTKLQKLIWNMEYQFNSKELMSRVVHCPSLKSLELRWSSLNSIDSKQFPVPLNITDLDLSFSSLSSFTLHSDVFPHLQTLDLSYINDIHWNISDKAILKSLNTLTAGFSIETYQIIFQSLDSLEELYLHSDEHLDSLLNLACGTQDLQTLRIHFKDISVFPDSLLVPCSNLRHLDLSGNDLVDLAPASLQMLTRLSILNLGSNSLTKVPQAIRNLSSLAYLSLYLNRINKISCGDFSGLQLLKVLVLSDNIFQELSSCVFQDLHSLEKLYIDSNLILELACSFRSTFPSLLVLKANYNNISKLPKGVFRNLTHLIDLDLQTEFGEPLSVEPGAFDGLEELREMSISSLDIIYSPSAGVDVNSSCSGHSEQQQVFNLPSLQKLSLAFWKETCLIWSQDLFQGLYNLKELSWNGCFASTPDFKTFHHTPQLLHLQMTNSKGLLPVPELFQPLQALQTLDLSKNHLRSLDFLSEANLTQLQTLILQKNELSVINPRVFEALPSLRYLDLSKNPFACDCSNVFFIHWLLKNKQVYVKGAFQYTCVSPPSHLGTPLLDFNIRGCLESLPRYICTSVLVLLMLLSTFLHHFLRLHLLYGFYLLRAAVYHKQKLKRGCEEIYDAFVSYSVHDEEWVYRQLVPELEGRQGWKLCLHHRDFEPGKAILENITDAIYSSRKTLCVISHHYLLSEWCSREIQMASFRLLDEQKDVLVLVLLEELSANQLSPFFRMRKLLRSRTYLSWSGARRHRGLFWERLRRALQSGTQLPAENPLPADD